LRNPLLLLFFSSGGAEFVSVTYTFGFALRNLIWSTVGKVKYS